MSVVRYPEMVNSKDVKFWDNAAFDNGGDLVIENGIGFPWSNIEKAVSSIDVKNRSFELDCGKENLSPSSLVEPGQVDNVVSNVVTKSVLKMNKEGGNQDCVRKEKGAVKGRDLDFEIEEIEKEIGRLSTRLESLRVEKANRNAKVLEKRGGIMAGKFIDLPKKELRRSDEEMTKDEFVNVSGKLRTPRRGVSLGPAEIMRDMRRGVSVGPMEIYSATKMKNLCRQEVTPIQSSANRRKSCYWKLHDIDELRVTKERGKSMSLSPKSRCKSVTKPQIPKKAATTMADKKNVRKEDGVIASIQPKKLFVKDAEKSVGSKKPLKSGRVVASRYNQNTSGGISALKELRKRSSSENEEEIKRSEKKRVSLVAKSGVEKNVDHNMSLSVSKILEVVPKIKTCRCMVESSRDSGPAKRVAELVGRKSFFSIDDESEDPDDKFVCQALSFEEEPATNEYPKIRVVRTINESPRDSGAAKRVSQLVGRKPFFASDDDDELPVFSFEEDIEEI